MINEDKDGKAFTIYCDADRFEKYLLELAPEDSDVIKEFTQAIRTVSQYAMPVDKPAELYDASDQAKMGQMLPGMQLMQKWGAVSLQDFAQRLKNPYLRRFFANFPALPMAMLLNGAGLAA